jgi:hypothetical protein
MTNDRVERDRQLLASAGLQQTATLPSNTTGGLRWELWRMAPATGVAG